MKSLLILQSLFAASLAATTIYDIKPSHFATEADAKAATDIGLSPWGYHASVLPRVYNLTTMSYSPSASLSTYNSIIAGSLNSTLTPTSTPRRCNNIHLIATGPSGCRREVSGCTNLGACEGSGCAWDQVTVVSVDNAYVTFWTSSVCNGAKGSINPDCGMGQSCNLKALYQSFRTYDGCHTQPDDGCR